MRLSSGIRNAYFDVKTDRDNQKTMMKEQLYEFSIELNEKKKAELL